MGAIAKMKTYCKTLNVKDYVWLAPEIHYILSIRDKLEEYGASARFEHAHRAWEYGMITRALIDKETTTVLDIGGGGSVFAPAYASYPFTQRVVQVDPGVEMQWIKRQEEAIGRSLPYAHMNFFDFNSEEKFEAVVSISVIEHIPNDIEFFKKMLSFVAPEGLVALTFDFHPSGEQKVDGHIRTYSESDIRTFIEIGKDKNFKIFGDYINYTYWGDDVNNYTFGCMILQKDIR